MECRGQIVHSTWLLCDIQRSMYRIFPGNRSTDLDTVICCLDSQDQKYGREAVREKWSLAIEILAT